ncbi:hypothetical protein ACFL6U_10205 [Planctomycetota bacterium]
MSTLTKVLIVLQTVFTIFLCGIVVTYVGNADNWKEKTENAQASERRVRNEQNSTLEEWDVFKSEKEEALAGAIKKIEALTAQNTDLAAKLDMSERDRSALTQRIDGLAGQMTVATGASDKQRGMYEEAQAKLDTIRDENIVLAADLKATNDVLIQKLAVIETQNEQLRRLTEEKTELRGRMEKTLLHYGGAPKATTPVTQTPGLVRPALPMQNISLKGRITDLNLADALAEISIGSAAGLKNEMKLHVTRGNEFVCSIVILDTDAEKAVGILDMVKSNPRVGDVVSTNF